MIYIRLNFSIWSRQSRGNVYIESLILIIIYFRVELEWTKAHGMKYKIKIYISISLYKCGQLNQESILYEYKQLNQERILYEKPWLNIVWNQNYSI